jgi:RND family efflux transporter MFP subunit
MLSVSLALGAAVLAGCGRNSNGKAKVGPDGLSLTESSAIVVNVAEAVRGDIAKTLEVTGSLVALNDVSVGAKSSGKLVAVYPREGEAVRAGQVVAEMDTSDLRAQLAAQEAAYRTAVTRLDQARAQLQQAKSALQNSETQLNWTTKTTETSVQTAEAALQTAQERLAVVKQGARAQERRQAEESVRGAKANYDKARSDLKRMQALFREQAVSQSQLDQAQASADGAEASYRSAMEALSLIREGARPEDIRTAELAVLQARQGLDKANADRAQVALRQADVQSARDGVRVATSSVRAAEAGMSQAASLVRIARQALADASIRSPISGYVAARMAEPGQQVAGGGMGGAAILRIVAPGSVYFQANVSETQVADVRLGQHVDVTVDALPGRTFSGTVTRILPVASMAARAFTLRIDFPVEPTMKPQMFARGRILLGTHRATVLVPKDAVVFDPIQNRSKLFVKLGSGTVQEREVKIGYTNPEFVEIVSGVRPAEAVVVQGQNALQDGDKVRVQ